MSFTDQQPHTVTERILSAPWYGIGPQAFRCSLCGYRFGLGDIFRFVFVSGPYRNLLTCESCDGEDVADRWRAFNEEIRAKGYLLARIGEE